MPKILGNSLGEYNKSCSASHQEFSKIEFAIFQILYDFLKILQVSAICIYQWRYPFAPGTLQRLGTLQPCPWFATNTLEKKGALQLGPWASEAAAPAELRRAGRAPGRGGGGAWPHAHLGRGENRGSSGDGSGEGARRRSAVAAPAGCGSGRGGAMPSNGRRCKFLGHLGSRLGRLGALEKDGEASSPAAGNGGRGGAAVTARGGRGARFL
jgi:hypothetical protein